MGEGVNWGILATGKIAARFADDLRSVPGARLAAVASRTQEGAEAFGERFSIPRRYGAYEALAADPNVDVVYIGTPNHLHYENTLLCLNAGKHVLCEKPLALNRSQVQEMIDAARANSRFLMEAMWMWFIPATVRAKALVDEGAIGAPHVMTADFGFAQPFDPASRWFNPALGGGALLDIGIYPLALALFLFGKANRVTGKATIGASGVDEQMTATLEYGDGQLANLTASFRASLPGEAVIGGTGGHLRIHRNFWHSRRLTITGAEERSIDVPYEGNGLRYEAQEVMARLREGALESNIMSWRASLNLMEMMDTLRGEWGQGYPGERGT